MPRNWQYPKFVDLTQNLTFVIYLGFGNNGFGGFGNGGGYGGNNGGGGYGGGYGGGNGGNNGGFGNMNNMNMNRKIKFFL